MKSLFKTVFIIIFFTGITRLLGFIFRIWLSRTIGAEALGIYQISFSVFMVLLTLVSSGIPLIISRLTAKHIANKDKKAEITCNFCNKKYTFNEKDLQDILNQLSK